MPNYRRLRVDGGTFVFTIVAEHRQPILTTPLARTLLRSAFTETQRRWPFCIDAVFLLPDHLHAIWSLPSGDCDYSRRWAFLKKQFVKSWIARGGEETPISESRLRHRRRGVLQRRYWEHAIRDDHDFIAHVEYIHFNPVKHGLVRCPHDWPYSSFHRYVRNGLYERDWACACGDGAKSLPTIANIEKTIGE